MFSTKPDRVAPASSNNTGCAQLVAVVVVGMIIIGVVLWLLANVVIPVALLNSALIFTVIAFAYRTRKTVFAGLAVAGGCYLLFDIANGWFSASFVNNVVKTPTWLTAFVYVNAAAIALSTWQLLGPILATAATVRASNRRRGLLLSTAAVALICAAGVIPPVIYHAVPNPFVPALAGEVKEGEIRARHSEGALPRVDAGAVAFEEGPEGELPARGTDGMSHRGVDAGGVRTTDVLKDSRDGHVYTTVKIGQQWWMSENLNYELGNSWCFGDEPANCRANGRLYDWPTARKACPPSWHLPADDEWRTLEATIGLPSAELDKDGWRGTDEAIHLKLNGTTGFNARMAGYRTDSGRFVNFSNDADFWTATEATAYEAWTRRLTNYPQISDGIDYQHTIGRVKTEKSTAFYVRCVQHTGAAPVVASSVPTVAYDAFETHDPNGPGSADCVQCGAYVEKARGEQCIEINSKAIFHFWHSDEGPANFGAWQLVDGKMRWYLPPESVFKGREAEIEYSRRDPKRWRAFLGRMIAAWDIPSDAKYEEIAYDSEAKQLTMSTRIFVKTGQRRCYE